MKETMSTNTADQQPVKPALSDDEIETIIAEYLTRQLEPLAKAAGGYVSICISVDSTPNLAPRIERKSYSEFIGHRSAKTVGEAVALSVAALGSVGTATELRSKAAILLEKAAGIEARALKGGAE